MFVWKLRGPFDVPVLCFFLPALSTNPLARDGLSQCGRVAATPRPPAGIIPSIDHRGAACCLLYPQKDNLGARLSAAPIGESHDLTEGLVVAGP